jgi:hypothetical protein
LVSSMPQFAKSSSSGARSASSISGWRIGWRVWCVASDQRR